MRGLLFKNQVSRCIDPALSALSFSFNCLQVVAAGRQLCTSILMSAWATLKLTTWWIEMERMSLLRQAPQGCASLVCNFDARTTVVCMYLLVLQACRLLHEMRQVWRSEYVKGLRAARIGRLQNLIWCIQRLKKGPWMR